MKDKIKLTAKSKICLVILICTLVISLTSCDFHIMSKREVEKYLEKQYGQEFTVLSSEFVTDDYYDDVWRVKAYVVSPKDKPDICFYAYNIVEGENFGIPGFRNSLRDTYSLDIFAEAFEAWVVETDVEYTFNYFYPIKSSSVYYSSMNVTIKQVTPENLETVCTLLSHAYTDTFEKIQDIPSWVTIRLTYREPLWPEDTSCLIIIDNYELLNIDTDAESIQEYILNEVNKYEERSIL